MARSPIVNVRGAAIGNPRPRPPKGGGGLGGLEPPIKVPTIPGSFGRPALSPSAAQVLLTVLAHPLFRLNG